MVRGPAYGLFKWVKKISDGRPVTHLLIADVKGTSNLLTILRFVTTEATIAPTVAPVAKAAITARLSDGICSALL